MRKLIALFGVTAIAASALGQGQVSFRNNDAYATTGDRLVRFAPQLGGGLVVGTDYVAQLWAGTSAGSLSAVTTANPVRFRVATTSSPGTWVGVTATLPGITAGQTATLMVRVWNLAAFPTYDAAVAGLGNRGQSDPFTYVVPATGSPPAAFFMENLRSFQVVPEPATIALGVLGVAGLLFIRRRK